MPTTLETVQNLLRERFNALSLPQKILAGVGGLVVGFATYATTYALGYRLVEKRKTFNAYTTSEQAINGVDLSNKICIVTGCNTGIGKETVKILYKQNCNIIMACRNTEAAAKAMADIKNEVKSSNGAIAVMKLDLSSLQSVRDFAEEYSQTYKELDLLINNAGIMALPYYKESAEEYELQFAVNHLGHFYLTNLLLPQLKTSKGRVINLSSSAHTRCSFAEYDDFLSYALKDSTGPSEDKYGAGKNYGISKASNIFFARESQRRWAKYGVTSVSLHPGAIFGTELGRSMKPTFFEMLYLFSDVYIYLCVCVVFMFVYLMCSIRLLTNVGFIMDNKKTISQGAATTLRCVSMTDDEIQGGHFYWNCNSGRDYNKLRGACLDALSRYREGAEDSMSVRLWKLSEALVTQRGFAMSLSGNNGV